MPSPLPPRPIAASVPPTKLNPPGLARLQVARDAIAERVLGAPSARLVLVRAPAGFGKTTAMQQTRERLEAGGISTAWLTLDRADNDLPRFLSGLAAAVLPLQIEAASGSAAPDVVDLLARAQLPFALFLDDFEVIQAPAVLSLVRELVERLPRRGQLVIGSRSLPDLPLGRLRARGQLLEIDTAALRFSPIEAGAYFRLRGDGLAPAVLDHLHHKTEGWITALWLVSIALERHGVDSDFVARFSGSDRAIAEYLAEDVVAHQPPEVRDFLLRTSILRTLSADVCAVLVPQTDSGAMLRRLEAANLFVTPIDGAHEAYRFHSLFGDFLRAQLARERPGDVAALHLAASAWYEAQGRPVPAIDHAIEGGDAEHALTLLAQHAEAFLEQGRMRLLDRWFTALPAACLSERPLLQVVAVWAECFTRGPWRALQRLEASGCTASDDAAVQAHVNALQPLLLAMMDRDDDASVVGRANLARMPSCRPFADSVLANAVANIVSVIGERDEAHRLLDTARRLHGGSDFNRMYTESVEGTLDLAEGRLRQATARFRMAVSATPRAESWNPANGNAWAGVLYAGAVYETNDLDAADQLLNVYLPLARDVGLPDHMIASHRMRARITFERGDVDGAFKTLAELEYLGHERQLPRVVASAKLERARTLVLQGHGPAARDELNRADDPQLWARVRRGRLPAGEVDDIAIGRLRWALHFGDAVAAAASLRLAAAEAEQASRRHRALKLRTLQSLAQLRAADPTGAVETMNAVLQLAAPEGFMRLLLDEGPLMGTLLQRVKKARSGTANDDPIVSDHLQQLLRLLGAEALVEEHASRHGPAAPPAESLTRREIRALQLLAEGYSNSAMAEKLFVSDSTIRTHLRNINAKLGARSRTQAVALARRLGIVD